MMKTTKHSPKDPALSDVLKLIQSSFAYMDNRIDPPSSMHRLSLDDIAAHCSNGEVWSIGTPPIACLFMKVQSDAYYVGKLAVSEAHRGKGLARTLVNLAADRAKKMGLLWLELETRIELVENHATFARLGFIKTAEASHCGYQQPTYIVMRKPV